MLLLILIYYSVILKNSDAFLETPSSQRSATVMTSCGMVQGLWMNTESAYEFRGIPYASPPVGKQRWRPPLPLKRSNTNCWNGIYNASTFGSPCFQQDDDGFLGSEDCLYLNVWTPDVAPDAALPVMVWIHGGSLLLGNGNAKRYSPSATLARQTNTVYVSMNYRLQAFGFMALKWLKHGSPTNTSGNYGFMDMIEVLRWVQDNIRNFGGNPNEVTVFGQSSGGTAIFGLLASPLCQGLFHKAWLMSASPILNKTAEEAFRDNAVFVNNTGCTDVDCLYGLTAEEVTSSIPWNVYPFWAMSDQSDLPERGRFDGALAIVDGYVLKEAPFDAWIHGNGVDVPLMIGSNAQEVDAFLTEAKNWTWDTGVYERNVREKLNVFSDFIAEMALHLYPVNVSTPEFQLTSMISDSRTVCGNDYLSLIAATAFQSPVYRYVTTFNLATPFNDARYSFHGVDRYAFLRTLEQTGVNVTDIEVKIETNFREEMMSFLTNGHPNTATWRTYPESTAVISGVTTATGGYHVPQCQFWMENGFFSYSWIN